LLVAALLCRARSARGCTTPGDDRLETRAYAVKRYLFRLGHAQRSARFACSIEQLVLGLAPVMGWTAQPGSDGDRGRFVRAHRKSVQRWLDDLQAAGLVAHEPERDAADRWWRTQIVLLVAPEPSRAELRCAQTRAQGWRRRERARRARAGGGRSRLAAIREHSAVPTKATRRRRALARRAARDQQRRDARVDAVLAERQRSVSPCAVLTHPAGAAPTAPTFSNDPERSGRAQTLVSVALAAPLAAQASQVSEGLAAETGARDRVGSPPTTAAIRTRTTGTEDGDPGRDEGSLIERVARREAADANRRQLQREHAARRAAEVARWPVGRSCPSGRLREAWSTYRHGLSVVADSGSTAAGAPSATILRRLRLAIERYEQHAQHRPAGWPASGPGAVCALATQGMAAVLAGDAARLLILANEMRAVAREHEPARTAQAARRAARSTAPPAGRLAFRHPTARWETDEQRRQRVRRAVLAAGRDPAGWPNAALASAWLPHAEDEPPAPELIEPDSCAALDGVGARAHHYRRDLDAGRWALVQGWKHLTDHPNPQEETAS
jgi:hypothetical protein